MRFLVLAALGACSPGGSCESVFFPPVSETAQNESIQLHGCFQASAERAGTVLLVHGLEGDHREWQELSDQLVTLGLSTLRLDLRGHGRSGGTFPAASPDSFGVAANDVRGAVAWLLTQSGVDSARLILVGSSLGGGAVIATALEEPTRRFIAWYPGLTYLSRGDSIVTARSEAVSGLIIQGTMDTHSRANPALTKRFVAQNPAVRVEWIEGAGHGAGAKRRHYERLTLRTVLLWSRD